MGTDGGIWTVDPDGTDLRLVANGKIVLVGDPWQPIAGE